MSSNEDVNAILKAFEVYLPILEKTCPEHVVGFERIILALKNVGIKTLSDYTETYINTNIMHKLTENDCRLILASLMSSYSENWTIDKKTTQNGQILHEWICKFILVLRDFGDPDCPIIKSSNVGVNWFRNEFAIHLHLSDFQSGENEPPTTF